MLAAQQPGRIGRVNQLFTLRFRLYIQEAAGGDKALNVKHQPNILTCRCLITT